MYTSSPETEECKERESDRLQDKSGQENSEQEN
jgi:hypothetical protein